MPQALHRVNETDNVLQVNGMTYTYLSESELPQYTRSSQGAGPPQIEDVRCSFPRGSRVLIAGANGAGKSTLMSIMGGKKMVPRGECHIYGKDVFHDSKLNEEVMYCGDWWRTDYYFNLSIRELVGKNMESPRTQHLIDILQIDPSWRINAISDGQRRRCQLLETLCVKKSVYIMDEITTDLDLFAREGLLRFLKEETETGGATVFYATHIFDCLADWATHVMFFAKGKVTKCCSMDELQEYHDLVKAGERVPLYALMKQWVFQNYPDAVSTPSDLGPIACPDHQGPVIECKNLSFTYAVGLPPVLKDMSFSIERGSRVLVLGANGAAKSTVMSILGGKRMVPRGKQFVLGKCPFNDTSLGRHVMYMGDWWRTKAFMNLTFREMLSEEVVKTPRCQHLARVLEVDFNWKINSISDGMRRRCQLLDNLAVPKEVYFMDEITSDLDIYAREGILRFLTVESELRGATIFYCTHIFDHLEGWGTHLLHLSKGTVVRSCPLSEVEEYSKLIVDGVNCPLYTMMRNWVYAEYEEDARQPKRAKVADSLDGRIPNLGLAGPFQMMSG